MIFWTPAEDAALRAACDGTGGMDAAIATIPGRSRVSIEIRARRLGLVFADVKRRWKPAEEAILRDLWLNSELDVPQIAARLRRRPGGVFMHAVACLKLGAGCPEGWEPLQQAADRTGYAVVTLRKILLADGVVPRDALSDPFVARGRFRRQIVMPAQVDAAVAAWLEGETVTRAAERLGLWEKTLRAWLRAVGVKEPAARGRRPSGRKRSRVWRVTDDDLALALAWGSAHRPRAIARAPLALSMVEAGWAAA